MTSMWEREGLLYTTRGIFESFQDPPEYVNMENVLLEQLFQGSVVGQAGLQEWKERFGLNTHATPIR